MTNGHMLMTALGSVLFADFQVHILLLSRNVQHRNIRFPKQSTHGPGSITKPAHDPSAQTGPCHVGDG